MKSILRQTEIAFSAFLAAHLDGDLSDCTAYRGFDLDPAVTLDLPAIIVSASNPVRYNPEDQDETAFELTASFALESQADDDGGSERHYERLAALAAILNDFSAVFAWINPANATRGFSDYTLSALVYEDETHAGSDRHLRSVLQYYVSAAPADS